jgi:hypothetical protein
MIDFRKPLWSRKQKAGEGKADLWEYGWMVLDAVWRNTD